MFKFPFVIVRRSKLAYLEQVRRKAERFINTGHASLAGMATEEDCGETYADLEAMFDNDDYIME